MADTYIPPGRPGNLSRKEEAALKDFWRALLSLFGVHPAIGDSGSATSSSQGTDPNNVSRKKKSHWLKRNPDSNDKYSLWKYYEEVLETRTSEEMRDAFWSMIKHENPDAILLRFLRARRYDVQSSVVMLISNVIWRTHDVLLDDDVMFGGEELAQIEATSPSAPISRRKDGADFTAQLKMGKAFLHGSDRDGRPVAYIRVRIHRIGAQTRQSLERFIYWTFEHGRLLLAPPNDQWSVVFDLTDFSLMNMDYTPVQVIIKCFEARYPEMLGHCLIYRAPWIFHTIWPVIRGWLDPNIAAKCHFVRSVGEMEKFIERDKIMAELDGEEDWAFAYTEPDFEENKDMADTETRDELLEEREDLYSAYEAETLAWLASDGDLANSRRRDLVAKKLRQNYWQVDPYIRARSIYDRMGMLNGSRTPDLFAGGVDSQSVEAAATMLAAAEQNIKRRHQGESQVDVTDYQKHQLERVDEMYSS